MDTPERDATARPPEISADPPPLVAHLERENAWLRAQVDAHQQAEAELRKLLALALQRPALPAPRDEHLQTDGTGSRPWWRRWRALWRLRDA
jgi:hypothetical protein